MELPNKTQLLDVSDVRGITEALDIEWSSRDYEGKPAVEPAITFDLNTHGALKLTLANGDVLVVGTSEWCSVDYYPHTEMTPNV